MNSAALWFTLLFLYLRAPEVAASGCSNVGARLLLTGEVGSFDDGGEGEYGDYGSTSDCGWIIAPTRLQTEPNIPVILEFPMMETEDGFDFVYIYRGVDETGDLLYTMSGSNPITFYLNVNDPARINDTNTFPNTTSIYVHFVSDATWQVRGGAKSVVIAC